MPSGVVARAARPRRPRRTSARLTAALPRNGTDARWAPSERAIRQARPLRSRPRRYRQRAELDECRARLASRARVPASATASAGTHSRSSSVSTRLAQPGLLIGQFEVHGYSCASASTRSAMMLRWIWPRPAVNGGSARVEVGLLPEPVLAGRGRVGVLQRRPEQLDRRRRESLLGLGHQQLDARAVGADRSAAEELTDRPISVVAQHLDPDQRLASATCASGSSITGTPASARTPPRRRAGQARCAA